MKTIQARKGPLTISLALTIAALILGGAGCGKDPGGDAPSGTPKSMSIPNTFGATTIGQTAQFTAVVLFTNNTTQIQTTGVEWSSSDTSIATVSPTGLVTATGGFGFATITAKYSTFTATRPVSAMLAVKSVKVTGNVTFTQAGQTSQLTATGTLPDGSTRDLTTIVTWRSNNTSIATVSSAGFLTAVSLGTTTIAANYTTGPPVPDPPGQAQTVMVTPDGTFVAVGFVQNPGFGAVSGIHVTDHQSGRTTLTSSNGSFVLAGLTGSPTLAFSFAGFELAEQVFTGSPGAVVSGFVQVQPVIRITAGQSGQARIVDGDIGYDVSPTNRCERCRLIRIVSPTAGTVHLKFAWNRPAVSLTAWIAGQPFPGASPGPLNIDVPVGEGEMVLYVGVSSGQIAEEDFLTLTVTTTFSILDGAGTARQGVSP